MPVASLRVRHLPGSRIETTFREMVGGEENAEFLFLGVATDRNLSSMTNKHHSIRTIANQNNHGSLDFFRFACGLSAFRA
jgi:hypothetical protein